MRTRRLMRTGALGAAAVLTLALAACGGGTGSGSGSGTSNGSTESAGNETGGYESNKLVVYTQLVDHDAEVFTELIEAQFPDIELEMVYGSTGESIARISAESGNPQGDMMLGGANIQDGDMHAALFEPWVSDYDDTLEPEFRSSNGYFNYYNVGASVLLVNTDIEKELGLDIQGYADLLAPELKGKVLSGDPLKSAGALSGIHGIHTALGLDSDEAWDFIDALLANGLVIGASSSAQTAGIAGGEYAVSIANENTAIELIASGLTNVRVVYPEEGTSGVITGLGIIKGGPNPELAKDVGNYIMSPEGQAAIAVEMPRRMTTSADIPTHELLPPLSEINWLERDWEWVHENPDALRKGWEELFTKHHS
ncbi:extracellular solute-binding protein [Microbacterium sp. No. 7]|uniref:extracellular solute-binding protein n=1 Tax=Microbacterium sp. No. 7 TaxID=1714373 RepID=UPI0006ED254E|nr:extracellular solute-binding protein [Microbacterium sp. No. 7]ALJ18488.1 hypothetical protein AOA12_00575 [Microbacterium sp. No. 7]